MAPGLILILNELCSYTWIVPRYLADMVRKLLSELLDFLTDGSRVAYDDLPFRTLVVLYRMLHLLCVWYD